MIDLEEMKREIKVILESNEKVCADCYLKLTEEIKQLQAENAKLKQALGSFAKIWDNLPDNKKAYIYNYKGDETIFRRAAEALRQSGGEKRSK